MNSFYKTGKNANADINRIANKWFDICRRTVPIDTGNLRFNGFTIRQMGNTIEIFINMDEAYYAEYVDASPKHSGYIQRFINMFTSGFTEEIQRTFPK